MTDRHANSFYLIFETNLNIASCGGNQDKNMRIQFTELNVIIKFRFLKFKGVAIIEGIMKNLVGYFR